MPTLMHFRSLQYWHRFLLILRMLHCWFLVHGRYWIFCWMLRLKKPCNRSSIHGDESESESVDDNDMVPTTEAIAAAALSESLPSPPPWGGTTTWRCQRGPVEIFSVQIGGIFYYKKKKKEKFFFKKQLTNSGGGKDKRRPCDCCYVLSSLWRMNDVIFLTDLNNNNSNNNNNNNSLCFENCTVRGRTPSGTERRQQNRRAPLFRHSRVATYLRCVKLCSCLLLPNVIEHRRRRRRRVISCIKLYLLLLLLDSHRVQKTARTHNPLYTHTHNIR